MRNINLLSICNVEPDASVIYNIAANRVASTSLLELLELRAGQTCEAATASRRETEDRGGGRWSPSSPDPVPHRSTPSPRPGAAGASGLRAPAPPGGREDSALWRLDFYTLTIRSRAFPAGLGRSV